MRKVISRSMPGQYGQWPASARTVSHSKCTVSVYSGCSKCIVSATWSVPQWSPQPSATGTGTVSDRGSDTVSDRGSGTGTDRCSDTDTDRGSGIARGTVSVAQSVAYSVA